MRSAVSGQRSAVSGRNGILICLLLIAYFVQACSIPNLETPDCTAARNVVREFYSFHFGNDMKFSQENLILREKFLTPEFAGRLRNENPSTDPFTLTADTPKAFRVGACTASEPEKRAAFEVLLFWKTDTYSEQRSLKVDAVNAGDKWRIDKVSAK